MHYLNELAERNDIAKTKRLSGVLFRGAWSAPNAEPNELWEDTKAECPIPEDISLALRKME
jgi:hypothetical protein